MWRQGSGRENQRSTGSRKHAHVDARVGKDKKIQAAATQDAVPQTHRQMKLEENMAKRSEMKQQMRLEARGGEGPDGRARLGLIADRRRDERTAAANAGGAAVGSDDEEIEESVDVGAQIARARRNRESKKKEDAVALKTKGDNTKIMVGVAVVLLVVASLFFS